MIKYEWADDSIHKPAHKPSGCLRCERLAAQVVELERKLAAVNTVNTVNKPEPVNSVNKPDRKTYMREYMRAKRKGKSESPSTPPGGG